MSAWEFVMVVLLLADVHVTGFRWYRIHAESPRPQP